MKPSERKKSVNKRNEGKKIDNKGKGKKRRNVYLQKDKSEDE